MNRNRHDPRERRQAGPELRTYALRGLRAEAPPAEGPIPFRGTPIVYNEATEIEDWWFGTIRETVAPGAAAEAIARDDVRLLVNHDPNLVLARRRGESGDTLRFNDTADALEVEAELAPTSYGRDAAISLARGDVSGMSFSFEVGDEEWRERPDGTWDRTILQIRRLWDVAIVTYPAYEATSAALRAAGVAVDLVRRAGRRNSAADEAVIRSAVDGLRSHADELDALIAQGAGDAGDAEAESARARAAIARAQSLRHSAFRSRHGMARA